MKFFLVTAAVFATLATSTLAQASDEMLSCYGHTGPQATDLTTFVGDVEIQDDRYSSNVFAKAYDVVKTPDFKIKVTLGYPYEEMMLSLSYKGATIMTKGTFFGGAELLILDEITQETQFSVRCIVE